MPNESLEKIKVAEAEAAKIRDDAKQTAKNIVQDATLNAEETFRLAEEAAEVYKRNKLQQISAEMDKTVASETDEAAFDASKVKNHADRVQSKAVDAIIREVLPEYNVSGNVMTVNGRNGKREYKLNN